MVHARSMVSRGLERVYSGMGRLYKGAGCRLLGRGLSVTRVWAVGRVRKPAGG